MIRNFFALAVIVLLVSCSQKNEEISVSYNNADSNAETAYTSLLTTIDSLNIEYGVNTSLDTKGYGGYLTVVIADAAGAKVGAWAGKHVGAAVGGAITGGNPCGAVVGYLGGRIAGRYAGYAAASYIASILCSYTIRPDDMQFYYSDNSIAYDGTYPPKNEVESMELQSVIEDATPGEMHNIILSCLMTNGKEYVIKETGEVKIEELYDDLVDIEIELGISDGSEKESRYKETMLDYCSEVARESRSIKQIGDDAYFDKIAGKMSRYGISDKEISELKSLCKKVMTVSYNIDEKMIKAYEKDVIAAIESSDLPDKMKVETIDYSSTAIRSTNLWNN